MSLTDFSLPCFPLQKLSGRTINPMLRMFGQSISGGVDMDGNGYPGMYAHCSGTQSAGGMQQQAEETAKVLTSRLLVPAIVGGW